MLADHFGQFKTVNIGHADVHEHNRDIILQQYFQRFPRGGRLEQIFA